MAPSPHLTSIKGFDGRLVEALLDEALALPYPRPVLGISGLQGSGKSTLAGQLVAAGKHRGVAVVAMSLDDFYLGRRERLALAKTVHPLLATRGPPGTHDLGLAHASLDALKTMQTGETIQLPRFDKLLDSRLPPSKWRRITTRPRMVVFEGWCLGVTPEDETSLPEPINALEREQDADSIWRRYCNHRLADYQPLWRRIDRLVFLQPPGFDIVPSLALAAGTSHAGTQARKIRHGPEKYRTLRAVVRARQPPGLAYAAGLGRPGARHGCVTANPLAAVTPDPRIRTPRSSRAG